MKKITLTALTLLSLNVFAENSNNDIYQTNIFNVPSQVHFQVLQTNDQGRVTRSSAHPIFNVPSQPSTYSYRSRSGEHISGTISSNQNEKSPQAFIYQDQSNKRFEDIATEEIIRREGRRIHSEMSKR